MRHNKRRIHKRMNESFASNLNMVYEFIPEINEYIALLIDLLDGETEEEIIVRDKLSKVNKYMTGIAFRPQPLDSQDGYYDCDPSQGCVITSECQD